MVGSSVGCFFFKIGQMMVSNGVIGTICSCQIDGVKWNHWSDLLLTSGRIYQKVSVQL